MLHIPAKKKKFLEQLLKYSMVMQLMLKHQLVQLKKYFYQVFDHQEVQQQLMKMVNYHHVQKISVLFMTFHGCLRQENF